jgi:TPR repeat protein
LGDPLAYWNLAIHYRDGTGVTKDLAQYIFLAEESASQGNYIAQLSLGEAYRLGFGVPQNKELAMSWYQSAATNNYPPAYYFLALGYSEDKTNHESQVKACRYWMLSAQAGNSLAQFKCAVMYMSGTVVNKDYSQYEKWLRKSADGGCPAAEYILGESLFTGSAPFQKNQSDGEKWIRKAAENDYVEAQWRLGTCLMTGRGVIQDSTEAVKWWNRAAEHGYANAQNDLGYALETSAAGEMDLVEACKWDKLAANQGLSTAILNLERVQTKLSDKQYQEAMIRVQDFHANPVKGFNPLQAEEKEDFLPALESPPPIP